MNYIKKILVTFVMLAMLFIPVNVSASSIIEKDEEDLISQILTYYSEYTKGDFNEDNGWTASQFHSDIDIDRCLNELKKLNPSLGNAYSNIMEYWKYADTTMPINKDVLPDGLPTDNSLCIVTLGFQLDQTTGEMQQELIDRLNVTLASAKKYPNAYIVVTGGGTSPAAPENTEGGEMAKWLKEHGIKEERIIVEDRAPTTVGNATYTFELLKKKPEIKSIAMISSASHIQRSVAIFETVFQLQAYKANSESIDILSNASCPVSRKETLAQQIIAVTEATNYCLGSNVKPLDSIELSTLNNILFENVNNEYDKGSQIEPKVIGNFTTFDGQEFQVDITKKASLQNVDPNQTGKQILNAKYSYNDVTKEISKEIFVKEKEDKVEKPEGSVDHEKEDSVQKPSDVENGNVHKQDVPDTGVSTNTAFAWSMLIGAGAIAMFTIKHHKEQA